LAGILGEEEANPEGLLRGPRIGVHRKGVWGGGYRQC